MFVTLVAELMQDIVKWDIPIKATKILILSVPVFLNMIVHFTVRIAYLIIHCVFYPFYLLVRLCIKSSGKGGNWVNEKSWF